MQSVDRALSGCSFQFRSQRMELYQASNLTDQPHREKSWLCNALVMRRRALQEYRARSYQVIEELRKICCTEAERATQLKNDELSAREDERRSTVNHLMFQIQEQQDKVSSLNDAKECDESETASSSGLSHDPSQPLSTPSPRFDLPRFLHCTLLHGTHLVHQDTFLKIHLLQVNHRQQFFRNSKNLASAPCEPVSLNTGRLAEQANDLEEPSECCNSNSELCKEVFNLESSFSCRRGLSAKLYD